MCLGNVTQQHGREFLGQRNSKGNSGLGPYDYKALSYPLVMAVR